MMPFSAADRTTVMDRMIVIAREDARVTGCAIIGSFSTDKQDSWSDIDITFGFRSGTDLKAVLDEWTRILENEFGVIHHFDVHSGSAIYRVILFRNCLEMDLSVVPEKDYGPRNPDFKLLFGKAVERTSFPQPSIEELIGFCWHHILHANSAICRGRNWQAEFWISGIRDNILALRCIRFGEVAAHARGVHRLPATEVVQLENTLVRSTEIQELRRALKAVALILIEEIRSSNKEDLAQRLEQSVLSVLTE